MGKNVVTTYFCDICKEVVENEEALKVLGVPGYITDSEGKELYAGNNVSLALCKKCREKLSKIVADNFAKVVDYPGGVWIDLPKEK